MRISRIITITVVLTLACVLPSCRGDLTERLPEKPNIVLIMADDLGYGDMSCYGNPTLRTPNLDRMAAEGIKFTQFYVAAPVCTPSRAALLTGCYPKRVGLHQHVLFPHSEKGIHSNEITLAEMCKEKGYKTACIGKWHLGHQEKFLPLQHGFDHYFGLPFSNDMSKKEQIKSGNTKYKYELPVIWGNDTIELDPDQTQLTKRLTEDALRFIEEKKAKSFFLYLAHPMPHIPIYASENFQGISVRGPYGDTVEEIDWSVGEILKVLREYKIDTHTLVIFTSDNGPWLQFKTHGGSAGPLRDGKGTTYEGGMREPCIMWWPEHIPAGTICTEITSAMDILPTIAHLVDYKLPESLKIDGEDIHDLLEDPELKKFDNREFYYYSQMGEIEAIRQGPWKLFKKGEVIELYNIEEDISEKYNLAPEHPDLVKELMHQLETFDEELTRSARPVGEL